MRIFRDSVPGLCVLLALSPSICGAADGTAVPQPVLTSELEYDTQLVPSPAMNEFGYSVAVSGDTVVVGARAVTSGTGGVYVYVRRLGIWHQQARLMASNAGTGDEFGGSVVISRDTIVVGARQAMPPG